MAIPQKVSCDTSPGFFVAGFRRLGKKFQRSSGNPSRVANTGSFCVNSGRTDASKYLCRLSVPIGMVRALRFVLGLSRYPSYTVSQTRSERGFRSNLTGKMTGTGGKALYPLKRRKKNVWGKSWFVGSRRASCETEFLFEPPIQISASQCLVWTCFSPFLNAKSCSGLCGSLKRGVYDASETVKRSALQRTGPPAPNGGLTGNLSLNCPTDQ